MHPSILVDAYECDALQAGDRHLPQREMRKEGVQPLTCEFLGRAGRTVLADGPGMRREDRGQLGQYYPGPKHLRHVPWCPREARVDHGEWRQEQLASATGAANAEGGGNIRQRLLSPSSMAEAGGGRSGQQRRALADVEFTHGPRQRGLRRRRQRQKVTAGAPGGGGGGRQRQKLMAAAVAGAAGSSGDGGRRR